MILPELPAKVDKRNNQINRFLGLNKTENYTVGELTDSLGLTSEGFPTLSQRAGVTQADGFTAPTALYAWANRLIVADGGRLYIDGTEVCEVEDGEKQFAVIHNTLVVWPDQLLIDLETGEVTEMKDAVSIPASAPLFSNRVCLSFDQRQMWGSDVLRTTHTVSESFSLRRTNRDCPVGSDSTGMYLYCYGFDRDAVEACWHDGAWDTERLQALQKTVALTYDPVALDAGEMPADYPCFMADMILIPDSGNYALVGDKENPPMPSEYAPGKYFVQASNYKTPAYTDPTLSTYFVDALSVSLYADPNTASTVVATVTPADTLYYAGNANDQEWAYLKVTQNNTEYTGYIRRNNIKLMRDENGGQWAGHIYEIDGVVPFSDAFLHGGYKVNITGTKYGLYDTEGAVIVSATPNKLTFAEGTLPTDDIYTYEVNTPMPAGTYYIRPISDFWTGTQLDTIDRKIYRFAATEAIPEGSVLYTKVFDSPTVNVWKDGEILATYDLTEDLAADYMEFSQYKANEDGTVVIEKDIPKLDFLVESNNRLWGVSNEEKTVYSSALGDPTDWWSSGLDDGSWQLAVASEGDFTGIIEYANAVLIWKEKSLVKVMGSYPSQYYTTEYQYPGVQEGSSRSLININGTLFYKGEYGFYAYTSEPVLISEKLGNLSGKRNAVSGSDGRRLYASVSGEVLVYDLFNRIWLKESERPVTAWAYADTKLYFLDDGLWFYDPESDEKIDWLAEFCTFIEGTSYNSVWSVAMGRKGYTKLILLLELAAGSEVKIEVKEDLRAWRTVGTIGAAETLFKRVPVKLNRCAKLQLRLTGEGRTILRAISREYVVGSDK